MQETKDHPGAAGPPDWTSVAPEHLLAAARAHGLTVRRAGARLIVRGPRRAEATLVPALLQRKAELLPLLGALSAEEDMWFNERAAIAEFEGQLPRDQAEQLAWEEIQHRRYLACGGEENDRR